MPSPRHGSVEDAPEKSPILQSASPSAVGAIPAAHPNSPTPVSRPDVTPDPTSTNAASNPGESKLAGSAGAAEPVGTIEGDRPEENPVGSVATVHSMRTSEGHRRVEEKPVGSAAAAEPFRTSEGHHSGEEKPVRFTVAGETLGTIQCHVREKEEPAGSMTASEPTGASEGHNPAQQKPVGSAAAAEPEGTSEGDNTGEQKSVDSAVASEPIRTSEGHHSAKEKLVGSAVAGETLGTSESRHAAEETTVGSTVAAERVETSEGQHPPEENPVGSAEAADLTETNESHHLAKKRVVGFVAAADPADTRESNKHREQKPFASFVAAEPEGTSEGQHSVKEKPFAHAIEGEPLETSESHHPAEEKMVESAAATEPTGTSEGHKAGEQKLAPEFSISGVSQRSLDLTAGSSSSLPHQPSGTLWSPNEMSKPRTNYEHGSSQTPEDSTGAYRSLTLQYSPKRRNQLDSWSRATSTRCGQEPWSPMSRSSPGNQTPSVSAAGVSRMWTSFALPPGATDMAQTKVVHSEELFKRAESGAVTAERAQSMTMQAGGGLHSQASLSPKAVSFWRSPRPQSPPTPDKKFTTVLSSDVPEFEDVLATPRIPWATLTLMWLAALAHWRFLHKHYPERCASAVTIVDEGHWSRAVFAAFHHEDFWHLASNLVAFFFKGIVLEAALGTTYFAALFVVTVFAVGLANTAIVEIAYMYTRESYLRTMCAHTFSGVVVALQVFCFSRYSDATLHYGKYEHLAGAHWFLLLAADLEFAWRPLKRTLLPIVIGVFVGLAMVAIVRVPYPRRHLYLVAAPKVPVTYAFMCSVVAAYLYGPYAEPSAFGGATLTFDVPVWRPFMLPPLYVGSVFHLAYVLLTLFAVGRRLERCLGALRFLLLAPTLLLAVSVLRDGLRFVTWKYQLAFWSTAPPPSPHSGDCFCGLVGTLLALKAVYHGLRPDAAYRLGSVCIQVSFWPGLLLELTHFMLHAREDAIYGHVIGALVGVAVSRLLRDRRWFGRLVPTVTVGGSVVGSSRDYPETPAPGID
ncbi:uncharacterized protein LOC142772228 [Rhipicephalus microplus]|uniref:uncharacterized protein LOC142772228 n=1 Tax=Rhipicephalus microplus TaxID=6941 RepID=UPI003F6D22EF